MKGELGLVERIRRWAKGAGGSRLVLGIGDDCAIFRPRGLHEDLIFTTDMLIEGSHFLRDRHPAGALGHKALARGLSDIAAMGGEPRFCLLSVALPGWADSKWTSQFFGGLVHLAKDTGIPLAGGDLAHAERFSCDIVVCGAVPKGKALRRDGARPGDRIFVSGRLGGSALGLATRKGKAWRTHLRPEPRLALGRFLRRRLRATAAMDLSDGLSIDLKRLCRASGVAAEIVPPPVFRGATLAQALHGGEDYELLFTTAPRTRVPADFEGLPLTEVGAIVAGPPGRIRLDGKPLSALGYDHCRQ